MSAEMLISSFLARARRAAPAATMSGPSEGYDSRARAAPLLGDPGAHLGLFLAGRFLAFLKPFAEDLADEVAEGPILFTGDLL